MIERREPGSTALLSVQGFLHTPTSRVVCFNAFHVCQLVHDALDAFRRSEVKHESTLKGSQWGLLKRPNNWTPDQITDMHWLKRTGLKTARAWRMKHRFQEVHQLFRAGAEPLRLNRAWICERMEWIVIVEYDFISLRI